ncbi:DUF4350 domain-containing protein [Maribacter sp. 2304DJ31-5]|uniref:DUF4350 domain-containing protein n=1 Tax=Maribacter sp. 2304DJ31-5 TaxID=3386273 RepID=UPI0039BC238C
MRKKSMVYVVITIVAIGILMLLQYNQPKKINWFRSYVATHKIPYGTYVLNSFLPKLLPGQIQQVHTPPFEFLSKKDSIKGTYLFINDKLTFEKTELEELLNWTSKGNTLFMASRSFEEKLMDTLKLETRNVYGGFEVGQKQWHQLVNPNLKTSDSVVFGKNTYTSFFSSLDTLRTTVLGTVRTASENAELHDRENCTTVRQSFGKGQLILSTFPEAFTNYFILKENNREYTTGLLSYLKDTGPVYVDNHYKSGKSFYTSPLYIFLNTKELKWAYYIVLIGAFIYILSEGKRKQRAVPVVMPLKNRTLAFTRTISDMYFEKGDQKNIAEHRINYFLDEIRSTYYLGTITKKDDLYKNLASRSGHSYQWIRFFFLFMEEIRNKPQVSDAELIKLNTLIQKFKSGSHGA